MVGWHEEASGAIGVRLRFAPAPATFCRVVAVAVVSGEAVGDEWHLGWCCILLFGGSVSSTLLRVGGRDGGGWRERNGLAAVCCILRRKMNGRQSLHPRGDEWRCAWLHPFDGRRMAPLGVASSVQWGMQMQGWKHVELAGEVRLAVEAGIVV